MPVLLAMTWGMSRALGVAKGYVLGILAAGALFHVVAAFPANQELTEQIADDRPKVPFQFSLLALLVLMVLVSVICGVCKTFGESGAAIGVPLVYAAIVAYFSAAVSRAAATARGRNHSRANRRGWSQSVTIPETNVAFNRQIAGRTARGRTPAIMPIRVVMVLLGLFAACLGVVIIAWAVGSDFYLGWPGRYARLRTTDDPRCVLAILVFCAVVFLFYSQHYGLVLFSIVLALVVVGIPVSFFLLGRTPTLVQWLLAAAISAETVYGWTIHGEDYFDY